MKSINTICTFPRKNILLFSDNHFQSGNVLIKDYVLKYEVPLGGENVEKREENWAVGGATENQSRVTTSKGGFESCVMRQDFSNGSNLSCDL